VAKPALDVLGRPLLASALDHLCRHCTALVVNVHQRPRQVMAAVRQACRGGVPVTFSWEATLLGGAGGVAEARKYLGAGAVLLANADVWTSVSLEPLLAAGRDDTVTLALLPNPDPFTWSSVEVDREGCVIEILPPGHSGAGDSLLFTGFQLLGAGVVAALPAPPGEMSAVWTALRRDGRLRGVVVEGAWREAGTPEAYRRLVVDLLAGSSFLGQGAGVAAGATLEGSAVGDGCEVAAGSSLVESLVTLGAKVGPECVLRRSIVAGGVEVPPGTHAEGELLLPFGRFSLGP